MSCLLESLRGEMATLMNNHPLKDMKPSGSSKTPKILKKALEALKGSSNAIVPRDSQCMDKNLQKIWQLGGKFAIMYLLWIDNIEAAFQTTLKEDYTPQAQFLPGSDWKRQGEKADLLEIFPLIYHADFNGNFIPPIVSLFFCFSFLSY